MYVVFLFYFTDIEMKYQYAFLCYIFIGVDIEVFLQLKNSRIAFFHIYQTFLFLLKLMFILFVRIYSCYFTVTVVGYFPLKFPLHFHEIPVLEIIINKEHQQLFRCVKLLRFILFYDI